MIASTRRRALFGTLDDWRSPSRLGGQQLARALVQLGWDVGYLSWPISPFHLLGDNRIALRRRFDSYRRSGMPELDGKVWAYVPGALMTPTNRPVLRSAWLHHHWTKLTVPSLLRQIRRRGFDDVDLLYLDVAIYQPLVGAVGAKRTVFRMADRLSAFDHVPIALVHQEAELVRQVDAVAYSAKTLEPLVRSLGARHSFHLPNGVDPVGFEGTAVAPEMLDISRPIAIYVGALGPWFDSEMLNRAVDDLPDVSFVVIGPPGAAQLRLRPAPNLHVLGPRPYSALPAYLRGSDVGLIPFDFAGMPDLVASIHPLKLYEYFAAGLPVVATRWPEIEAIGSPAALATDSSEFVGAIRHALADPGSLSTRRTFVEGARWTARAESLLVELGL